MECKIHFDVIGSCVYVEFDADLLDVEPGNCGPALLRMEDVCLEVVLRVRVSEVAHAPSREDTDVDADLPLTVWLECLIVERDDSILCCLRQF